MRNFFIRQHRAGNSSLFSQQTVHRVLSTLLQTDPRQRTAFLWFVLAFVIAISLSVNLLTNVITDPLGKAVAIISPIIVAALFMWWLHRQPETGQTSMEAPHIADAPPGHSGLIVMLSPTSVRDPDAKKAWDADKLRQALDDPHTDNEYIASIRQRFSASNWATIMGAIMHHEQNGALRYVWIISTYDGSKDQAPFVETLAKRFYGVRRGVKFIADDNILHVGSEDIAGSYTAVEHIYTDEAGRLGLKEMDIIADVTGGRVPMSCGMLLACVPSRRLLQYTTRASYHGDVQSLLSSEIQSADKKPTPQNGSVTETQALQIESPVMQNQQVELPRPRIVKVDWATYLRHTLDAAGRYMDSADRAV